ncbi:BSD domain-containing protein 1-like isoform X2 [Gigantopelta aegis]|uniref:BSD domain-containing protein 1-like isoform X2 n=1 Tax=Gigantopelta aegis TaxID=1735272 RepID=UPI001B88A875|nr:BSD domain-containing protein 1-like isoform X2 [Gigantopelta aegis]
MAESMDETQNSWWGGWLQLAKEKSLAAVDFVKRDLSEFTNTMSHDTTKIVEVTSSTIKDTLTAENTSVAKDKMKQSIHTLFNGLSKALIIPHDDDDEPKPQLASEGAALFDRSKARLHAIQVDPGTYLNEPTGPEALFKEWVKEFNMDEKKGHISNVLVINVEVRALYTKLVPLQMSHTDFWQRYFYKLHQLEMDEVRKQAMMNRAEQEREDSLGWEDDWSGDEDFEDLSNTDLTPSSETEPSVPECNPASLSSSILQPIPERGKEMPPSDEPESLKGHKEQDVQKNVTTACDNLPCDQQHTEVIPNQQESKQSASSVKGDEKFVSKMNPEPKLSSKEQQQIVEVPVVKEKESEPQPAVVEKSTSLKTETVSSVKAETVTSMNTEAVASVKAETVTSVVAADDIFSVEPASPTPKPSNDVHLVETISSDTLLAVEQSKGNTSTENNSNNNQTPDVEILQKTTPSSLQNVSDIIPHKTPEAEKPSLEIIPETPQSVLVQRTGDAEVPVEPVLVPESKDEQLASVPSGEAFDIKTKIKGDMVVVGSDRESPNSDSSGTKDPSTEDWEHDFDLEVTDEDLKAADEIAKHLDLDLQDDDWENWE